MFLFFLLLFSTACCSTAVVVWESPPRVVKIPANPLILLVCFLFCFVLSLEFPSIGTYRAHFYLSLGSSIRGLFLTWLLEEKCYLSLYPYESLGVTLLFSLSVIALFLGCRQALLFP